MSKKLTLELYSAVQNIQLPEAIYFKKIRINKLKYRITVNNMNIVHISVAGFDSNDYFNGISTKTYFFSIFVPDTAPSLVNYLANNSYDYERGERMQLQAIDINVYVDGVLDYSISPTNKMYLELEYD